MSAIYANAQQMPQIKMVNVYPAAMPAQAVLKDKAQVVALVPTPAEMQHLIVSVLETLLMMEFPLHV
jgi:hypothetical protein